MTWILEQLSKALSKIAPSLSLRGWFLALPSLLVVAFISLAYGSSQDLYNFFILNSVGLGSKQLTSLDLLLLLSAV